MKLRFHERPQQPRATDAFHQPEQNEWETFEAGHIIRRVIQVAQEKLGGMEKLSETMESAVLLFATRPDLIPIVFPNQTEIIKLQKNQSAGSGKIMDAPFLKKIGVDKKKITYADVNRIEARLPIILEHLPNPGATTQLLKSAVILALFMPHKRQALKDAVRAGEASWFKVIDLPELNPNVFPASSGALLRLLDPSTTAPLKEILARRARGWIEQVEEFTSPERTSPLTKRGINYYLSLALQESLGLEILLADEALIDDEGNFVITRHTKPLRASTPLPPRSLN